MDDVWTTPTPKVTQTTIIPPYRCLFINRSADWVKPFLGSTCTGFPPRRTKNGSAVVRLRNRARRFSLNPIRLSTRSRIRSANTGTRVLKNKHKPANRYREFSHETRTPSLPLLHEIRRLVKPIIACRSRAFVKWSQLPPPIYIISND